MKALCRRAYGPPEVLELRDIDRPVPTDDGVLLRVRAASVNRAEWYAVAGRPYIARLAMGLRKPRLEVPGADFAGTVEAVGHNVTRWLGPLSHWAKIRLASLGVSQKVVFFV